MHKKNIIVGALGFLVFAPVAFAQGVYDIFGAQIYIFEIIAKAEQLLWAIAIAVFFWGLVKFIANTSDTAAHAEGKKLIVWGIVSFLVLVSLWGIVDLIVWNTFGYTSQPVCFIDKNGLKICN